MLALWVNIDAVPARAAMSFLTVVVLISLMFTVTRNVPRA
eukprot:gene36994-34258_t